ncbi:MAG TPA: hypothetical protein VMU43_01765 [Candidatus Acidoferrum sp.]|nr:hypothetical protein [Candidatus Acidoferrum sp.]
MTDQENPDHVTLMTLLREAKPIVEPLFPDQKKKWLEESSLADEIIMILAQHPEYYDEVRAHIGDVIPAPKAKGTGA